MKENRLLAIFLVVGLCTIMLMPASVIAHGSKCSGNTFVVSPSGGDDTANIQSAFDSAVASGPRSTVKLTAGTFYLSRDIVVVNFDGQFKGAGEGKTIIETMLVPGGFPLHGDSIPAVFNAYPGIFVFYQDENGKPSTIKFSDMTIRVKGGSQFWLFGDAMNVIEIYGKMTQELDWEESYVNTVFKRMSFEGEMGPYAFGVNILNAIEWAGDNVAVWDGGMPFMERSKPLVGTQIITRCSFKNVIFGITSYVTKDSMVRVTRNSFDTILMSAFHIYDSSNSHFMFTRNELWNNLGYGVYFDQGIQYAYGIHGYGGRGLKPEMSSICISRNTIHCLGTGVGVGLFDFVSEIGDGKSLKAAVCRNEIILNDFAGGIYGYCVDDAIVYRNKITGIGFAGIYTGAVFNPYDGMWYPAPATGWLIVRNDVSELMALMAPIWLGPGTSHCKVVSRFASSYVLDEGTENHIIDI